MSSNEKFTLEIEVERESESWDWLFETLKQMDFVRGMHIAGIRKGWVSEETHDLLMRSHNQLIAVEREP